MSDILKLYFKDLTAEAQKRVTDFDSELPAEIIGSTTPMIGVRKRPKNELDEIIEKIRAVVGDKAAERIVASTIADVIKGKQGAGFAVNTETGEVAELLPEEIEEIKAGGMATATEITVGDDECDCPSCAAGRAEKSDNGGGDPLGIVGRIEPKDPTKWD